MRTSALEREMTKNKAEDHPAFDKNSMLALLSKWDDDLEAEKQSEEYYKDHQSWARKRVEYRRKESEKDDRDRESEVREVGKDRNRAAALADSFLEQQAFEINTKVNSNILSGVAQPLRLRMTRENVKTAPASPAKRSVEEAEGLLEGDEEEDYQASAKKKRLLIPLQYDGEDSINGNTSKQNQLRTLVSSIPSDTKGLWEYPIYWEGVDNVILSMLNYLLTSQSIIEGKIRPFATKKIIEAFGIQEQDLIDFVVEHISNHGSAESLAKELEMVCPFD
jgi:RNA-binding protein 25